MKMVDFIAEDLVPFVVEELMNKRTGEEIQIKEMPFFENQDENRELVNSLLREKVELLVGDAKENLDRAKYQNYTLNSVLTYLEVNSSNLDIRESCQKEIEYSEDVLKEALNKYNIAMNVSTLISRGFGK